MKISFVVDKLSDRSGGAERVLIDTANRLFRAGHQVEILNFDIRRGNPFYKVDFGISCINLRTPEQALPALLRTWKKISRKLVSECPSFAPFDRLKFMNTHSDFARALRRYHIANPPDVIVPFMPPAFIACALGTTGGIPIVASLHNVPEQDFANSERWDPTPYAQRRRLVLLDKMAGITVLLEEFRDWFPSHLHSRISVVPNAVEPVDPALLQSARRSKTVMAVGRLTKVKRFDVLLRAWSSVERKYPDWKLEIYGVGPEQKQLESLVLDLGLRNARLKGHVRDIKERYLRSAFLAHPAEFEGWGLVVTESLAAGMPVIAFADCSGVNRLVTNGVNGLLVSSDADRAEALGAALDLFMSDPAYRSKLSLAGPPSVANYSPDAVMRIWESVLGEVVSAYQVRRGKTPL